MGKILFRNSGTINLLLSYMSNRLSKYFRTGTMVYILCLTLLSVGGYVFAIDGTFGSSKAGSTTLALIRSRMDVSLNSGYQFQSNRNMGMQPGSKGMYQSIISYQKGNFTYNVPVRQPQVMVKFKTPVAPVIR